MLLLLVALAAVDAPITQVTVLADQARVVRTAKVAVVGVQTVELPTLRDGVDQASIRVEARGATVQRVELERASAEALRTDEAKALLASIDALDTDLDRLTQEQSIYTAQRDALTRVAPQQPPSEPLQAKARLNAASWAQTSTFASEALAALHPKLRAVELALEKAGDERRKLVERARTLSDPPTTGGFRVRAVLAGHGPTTLTLSYLVSNVSWTPSWDVQLDPSSNQVTLSLAGEVRQQTGEDWSDVQLVVSTALPSRVTQVPTLATWKIGVSDRFIPTPTPALKVRVPPPPTEPLPGVTTEADELRRRLAQLAFEGQVASPKKPAKMKDEEMAFAAAPLEPAPPAAAPVPQPVSLTSSAERAVPVRGAHVLSAQVGVTSTVSGFSLAPPPAWVAPRFGPDSPVTLSGGFDLVFAALRAETIPSGAGARRVPLWSARWPVTVERAIAPAIDLEASLIAELKNPTAQVLPGGPAQLFVGADPAGTASLKVMSPGETVTLPLGIDRALKPVRNVSVVETTTGVITKDEVGTYAVQIELVNPSPTPISVRVSDQVPVTTQKEVEVRLLEMSPQATHDARRGSLEWRATLAPQQKAVFRFSYSVKRPKGWKLWQQEVVR